MKGGFLFRMVYKPLHAKGRGHEGKRVHGGIQPTRNNVKQQHVRTNSKMQTACLERFRKKVML